MRGQSLRGPQGGRRDGSSQRRGGDEGRPREGRSLTRPLPKAAAQAFTQLLERKQLQNPGLVFDRYAPNWSEYDKVKRAGRDVSVKELGLREVCEVAQVDGELLKRCRERWMATARSLHAESFTLKADWRLIAGLGRKGPLEVGFTFHRYGFPLLPGSSLKGLARAWAFYHLAELLGEQELARLERKGNETPLGALERLLSEPDEDQYHEGLAARYQDSKPEAVKMADKFRQVFGTTGAAGLAVFLDAIPAAVPRLQLDIMNPHYPGYYQGSEPPTDWQSPRPVPFLTVREGSAFCFAVGWRRQVESGSEDAVLRAQAREWLECGLTELGAGAKTSAGYGYFLPPEQAKPEAGARQVQAAAATSEAAVVEQAPEVPTVTRRGTVVQTITQKRLICVRDAETGRVYRVEARLFGAQTPPLKTAVVLEMRGETVVGVRRE